jgi:hypothetical protein
VERRVHYSKGGFVVPYESYQLHTRIRRKRDAIMCNMKC